MVGFAVCGEEAEAEFEKDGVRGLCLEGFEGGESVLDCCFHLGLLEGVEEGEKVVFGHRMSKNVLGGCKTKGGVFCW